MNKKGFTLIELLVAVVIIAILTTISLVVYAEVQKRARDVSRKQDLRSIQTALTLYYQKNGRFPCSDPGGSGSAVWQKSGGDFWLQDSGCGLTVAPFDTKYINSLPRDPKNTSGFPWNASEYTYAYWSGQIALGPQTAGCPAGIAQYYILATKLENKNDSDRAAVKPYYFCNGTDEIIGRSELIPGDDIEDLYFITSQD